MSLLRRVKFDNRSNKTGTVEIIVKESATKMISEWYASHHAGDRFTIYVDGKKQKQDVNGAIL